MPAALWAASTRIGGDLRTRSSRPGEVAPPNPSRTDSASRARSLPAPRNASTAASAIAAFCAWCAPCSGRKMLVVGRRTAPAGSGPARRRRGRGAATPNSRPSRAMVAPTSAQRSRIGRIASSGCAAQISVDPLWMIPAFARAMSSMVSPSHSVWSRPIGVMTRRLRLQHVGGVVGAAEADLDDGDVDGRVGERGERHRGRSCRSTSAARRCARRGTRRAAGPRRRSRRTGPR